MASLQEGVDGQMKGLAYLTCLPEQGWGKERVLEEVNTLLGLGDFKVETGALSGTCHRPEEARVQVVTEVRRRGGEEERRRGEGLLVLLLAGAGSDCLHQPSQPRRLPWGPEDGGRGGQVDILLPS